MDIVLIPLLYYTFSGLVIVFSIINDLDLLLKITKSKTLFNIYLIAELLVSSALITYSLLSSNYILLIIGFVIFLSTLGGLWWRDSAIKMMNEAGTKYDYSGALTCFLFAALIYFFDSTASLT